MSVLQVMTSVLECDGCQAVFGADLSHRTAMSVRVAAGMAGWTFPQRINDLGHLLSAASDVCPACSVDWTPRVKSTRSRALKVNEQIGVDR